MIEIGRRVVIIIFGVFCMIGIAHFLRVSDIIPNAIYPTKSSPHKISIVSYDVVFPNRPMITLKHYVNGLHISDYVMVIKNGVHIQEPQTYKLPKFEKGTVEVNVELGDEMNSSFTLSYNDAKDLYQKGLLIYLDLANHYRNYDQFVFFASGKEITCYSRTTKYDDWAVEKELPSLVAIPPKENVGYASIYSGWKENEWVIEDIEG